MTLGRQVNDPFRLVHIYQTTHQRLQHQRYPRASTSRSLRYTLSISLKFSRFQDIQVIHIDDAVLAVLHYKQANDVRANKSGTAGDDYVLHLRKTKCLKLTKSQKPRIFKALTYLP